MEFILDGILHYYLGFALAGLTGFVIYLFKYMRSLQRGVKAILRNNIIHVYNASTERGYMPIYEQDALNALYDSYKGMGGNGTIERLMEELERLPIVDNDKGLKTNRNMNKNL